MRILLAGVPGSLGPDLARALGTHHEIATLDGDIRNLEICAEAADCDVVIHGLDAPGDETDRLDAATRGTWNLLTTTRAKRYVLLSSMRIFDRYDPGWQIDEAWSPRPSAATDDLIPYLAEVGAREISRSRPIECLVLRLGEVVSAGAFDAGPVLPDWLHVDDAVSAVVAAVDVEQPDAAGARWVPFHIVRGGPGSRYPASAAAERSLGFVARHRTGVRVDAAPDPAWPESPAPLEALPHPDRILILGAGGPIGAATTTVLAPDHRLRLAGRRSMAEVAAAPPQSEGAPLPRPAEPPHEERPVDITDAGAVQDAAAGMDAIINLSVLRHDPVEAFRVNTLGAWNVMRTAVTLGIRRVVHTGPILTLGPHPAGYTQDRDVGSDVPPRPGDNLYFVSKFFGQEICRIFAEQHAIACPTLLYCGFVDPDTAARQGRSPHPFSISWEDSGRSLAAAVRVERLATPFEVIHILADSPHDRYRNDAARRVLGWEPRDRLDRLWYRHDREH
jgi:nucleoside-diphosphate-sugar epimerase